MTGVDEMVAAAARQPGGTLMLRSDRLTPAELADEVLARARQVQGDGKSASARPPSPQGPDERSTTLDYPSHPC